MIQKSWDSLIPVFSEAPCSMVGNISETKKSKSQSPALQLKYCLNHSFSKHCSFCKNSWFWENTKGVFLVYTYIGIILVRKQDQHSSCEHQPQQIIIYVISSIFDTILNLKWKSLCYVVLQFWKKRTSLYIKGVH